jgi:acylphosphatase
MRCRRRVFYAGQVQGVGFRWTARRIASRFPVDGWVKNLPDGRVELLVEGEEVDVEAYLDTVAQHFGLMIRDCAVVPEDATGLPGGFEIVL